MKNRLSCSKKMCVRYVFTIVAAMLLLVITIGCSMISANYVPSMDMKKSRVSMDIVHVFYNPNDVPFKYKELGRIFLKNINYWADRDPAGQINKIRQEAAEHGADAVIIVNGMRKEGSFAAFNGTAGGNVGDVYQYAGIAIVKE